MVMLAALAGCHHRKPLKLLPPPPPPPAPNTVGQYHLPGFHWASVGRVLLVPVYNQSQYTRAGAEVRQALAAELQRIGQFEVVSPPPDYPPWLAESVHVQGRFDEAAMLGLGRAFNADVVLHVAITHYSPYPRPRLGVVVQAVGVREGKIVASVDGLWDATCTDTARRARDHYRTHQCTRPLHQLIRGPLPDDDNSDELALESPRLFQAFVCHEVVDYLVPVR